MIARIFPKADNVFSSGEDTFRRPDRYLFSPAFWKDALQFAGLVLFVYLLMRLESCHHLVSVVACGPGSLHSSQRFQLKWQTGCARCAAGDSDSVSVLRRPFQSE